MMGIMIAAPRRPALLTELVATYEHGQDGLRSFQIHAHGLDRGRVLDLHHRVARRRRGRVA